MFFYVPQNIHKNMTDEIESKDNILLNEVDEAKAEILKAAEEAAKSIKIDLEKETPQMLADHTPEFKPPAPPKGSSKKVLKPQIIQSILDLQDKLDVEKRPKSHFDRMTKTELEEYLAHLSNKAVNKIHGRNDELTKRTSVTDESDNKENVPEDVRELPRTAKSVNMEIENGAKALFQLNLILVSALELASSQKVVVDKIGTDLVGLTNDVKDNEEALKDILARIYEENREVLVEYLSPFNQYCMLMTTLAGNRAVKNKVFYEKKATAD